MTTLSTPVIRRIPPRRAAAASVLRLARVEGRRILRHPVHLALVLAVVAIGGISDDPLRLFREPAAISGALEYIFILYYGMVVFFAANLVASSSRRSGADTQFEATPVTGQARTAALCLGVLAPTCVAGLAAAVIYAVTYREAVVLPDALAPAELFVIPLSALGAGLLGVAVARWLPWPGVPLGVMVALVMWVAVAGDHGDWAWSAPWTTSYAFVEDPALLGGSQVWHAVYLGGLATLAALAALLRHHRHRRGLLAAGALVTVATLIAGTLQLP
jgi:hypothetical protein